jgi:hypothetical protein
MERQREHAERRWKKGNRNREVNRVKGEKYRNKNRKG